MTESTRRPVTETRDDHTAASHSEKDALTAREAELAVPCQEPERSALVDGEGVAATKRAPRLRLELERNDFVTVLWSLEAEIEDAKYHGGLETVEDQMRLHTRMEAQLRRHDLGR